MHDGSRPGPETSPQPAPLPPQTGLLPPEPAPPVSPLPEPLPIHAGRITVRRLQPSDLESFLAYRCNPSVGLYQGWTVMSRAEALAFLDEMSHTPCFPAGQWCQLAIADRIADQLLGDIGIHVQAAPETSAEVGFTLHPDWQGRGLAQEAVGAIIQALFTHTPVTHIVGITDARNLASIRLLERLGMQKLRTDEAIFRGEPCIEHTYILRRPIAVTRPSTHLAQEP